MFIASVFAAALSIAQVPSTESDQGRALLQALATAYQENHATFPFGTIRFDYTIGQADDAEKARKGDLLSSSTAKGFYAFRGSDARYEHLFPQEDLNTAIKRVSGNQVAAGLRSVRLLTNGSETLFHRIYGSPSKQRGIEGRVISPGTDEFYRMEVPMDLGFPASVRADLGRDLLSVVEGRSPARFVSIKDGESYEGIPTTMVVTAGPYGTSTLWADLQRGGIPLKTLHSLQKGGDPTEIYYDDLKAVSGHGWLPYSMTTVTAKNVTRITITEVSFDQKPPPETFRLEFETPVSMANLANGKGYTAKKVWDLNHLPVDSTPLSKPASQIGHDMPGEREAPPRTFTWLAVLLSACLVFAAFIWRMRAK